MNARPQFNFFFSLLIAFGTSTALASTPITVMSYNVENLFDTSHDEGKSDWAYLPLRSKRSEKVKSECQKISNPQWRDECLYMDWNESVLRQKSLNLGKMIRSSFDGKGPDILVLQEVENITALTHLVDHGLLGMGYEYLILREGPDQRGIDTAIISRLPLITATDHNVSLPGPADTRPTRNILEASFKVNGKIITVFANHWPSQANPTEHREAAAKTLVKAAKRAEGRGEFVIAVGDFNSLRPELNGRIGQIIRGSNNEVFVDGIEKRLDRSQNYGPTSQPGTHWYRGSWSFIDRVFVMQSALRKGMDVKWSSIDVHAPDFAIRGPKPFRFNAEEADGYSDHLPLKLELEL